MTKKYKILLVDDMPEWLKTYRKILEDSFDLKLFHIDIAKSARDAFLKIIEAKDYDLVVTDLEMEKIFDEDYAGSWLIKNLINREECKNIKFMIISGAYNVWGVANSFKVSYIAKSSLIENPLILKYKFEELLELNNSK